MPPDAGGGVDVGVGADDGAGIQDAVAADLHEVAQHGAELFQPVGTCSSPFFTTTSVLSDLTLEVTLPAPMWDL